MDKRTTATKGNGASSGSPTAMLHDPAPIKTMAEFRRGESIYSAMVSLTSGDFEDHNEPVDALKFRLCEAKRRIPRKYTKKSMTFVDITRMVDGRVKNQDASKGIIENGIAVITVSDPLARIGFMEYEPGTAQDLNNALERHLHVENNGHGKGIEHIKAGFFKGSFATVFLDKTIVTGNWGKIVYMGFGSKRGEPVINVQLVEAKIGLLQLDEKKKAGVTGIYCMDMTEKVRELCQGMNNGNILLFTPHTTGGITPINGDGTKPLEALLNELAVPNPEINAAVLEMAKRKPKDAGLRAMAERVKNGENIGFWHNVTAGHVDKNGVSHLQAVFLGPQYSVRVVNGEPALESHKIVYVDTDITDPRERKVAFAKYRDYRDMIRE